MLCKTTLVVEMSTTLVSLPHRWKVGRSTLSCWSISTTPRGCSHHPHQQLLKSIFAQARRPRGCSVRPLLARGGHQQWPPLRPGLRRLHGAAFVNAFSAHHRLNNHLQEHPTAVREKYQRRATLLMQSQDHLQGAAGHPSVGHSLGVLNTLLGWD